MDAGNSTAIAKPVRKHRSPYGYVPTEWICIMYICLFTLTTVIHLGQALYKKPRLYWVLPTIVTCGVCEILGWAGRLWSSHNPSAVNPFLLQITTTIIAPTFLTAGLYTILGAVIRVLGPQYSRLSAKSYLIAFIIADVIALVVQAIGGAKASLAFQAGRNPNPGGHIMLVGIFLQLVGICVYIVLATEFLGRVFLKRPIRPAVSNGANIEATSMEGEKSSTTSSDDRQDTIPPNVSMLVTGMSFATLFVLIRTIYRTVELIDGWTGRIITTQRFFNILDAAPITLALFILNVVHPRLIF
ncbi:hypothetical protein M422DRAFT_251726 [Sphaerobolus stellatus SS14]|uniref:RTA1-domain-containing protein n=1 Tax=Sphaerobolus stellatus (strain SS14) TaxID=990650 RepID=A0A0C9UP49_SPHS4|nr:hypothetical protein M422DRAFT_251726 [Sphaerobolus stellatus SS14]